MSDSVPGVSSRGGCPGSGCCKSSWEPAIGPPSSTRCRSSTISTRRCARSSASRSGCSSPPATRPAQCDSTLRAGPAGFVACSTTTARLAGVPGQRRDGQPRQHHREPARRSAVRRLRPRSGRLARERTGTPRRRRRPARRASLAAGRLRTRPPPRPVGLGRSGRGVHPLLQARSAAVPAPRRPSPPHPSPGKKTDYFGAAAATLACGVTADQTAVGSAHGPHGAGAARPRQTTERADANHLTLLFDPGVPKATV